MTKTEPPVATRVLRAPLFTSWRAQYVRLRIAGLKVGAAVELLIDDVPTEFQYTGAQSDGGAEVMLRLGFEAGQNKTLSFIPTQISTTELSRVEINASEGATIGVLGSQIRVPELTRDEHFVSGPFVEFAGFPLQSRVFCDVPFIARKLTLINNGVLFSEYEIEYSFEQNRHYKIGLRCFKHEPIIEVSEEFSLGLNARLEMVFNPRNRFDHLLSHGTFDFEGESQPIAKPLNESYPNDLLCRLQMPTLGEYAVQNNCGWFGFFNGRDESSVMIGVLGLHGERWTQPAPNMMRVFDCKGEAELRASLCGGKRFWLLYAGAQEKEFTPQKPFVFHRLHADWNALRLDEHLDLSGEKIYDESCWNQPGFFGNDYREKAQRNAAQLAPLRKVKPDDFPTLQVLLDPDPQEQKRVHERMLARFEKWVRQFQGFRDGEHDYSKNVIGFSRALRGLLLDYELLRKDEYLSNEEVARIQAYFAFAARRITDEGRWPHSKTWLHPDHPDSVRGFHAYPGEHAPDKLVWSNSLPNFQSDPICALLHLSTLIPDHPDAAKWQRFALDDVERNLDAYCSASGAWEESINYALYTLGYFIITFRALKNRTGINYFQDERMRRWAAWLTRFFGPCDKRFDAYTFPGVGNALLPQNQGEYLLAYAGELEDDDPLRADLIACYQKMGPDMALKQYSALLVAAMAPIPDGEYALRPLESEHMADLGVAMRDKHPSPDESYLFQKIGFWKDHYENDETSFNWYAKGTPLVMDYGTYTPDVSTAAAHNLIEIPDMDSLRRGYLADSFFGEIVDYTRCEVPVTLKLSHGHVRSFEEVDGPPQPPIFHYIGDDSPLGPKIWKTRLLMFVKPDYLVVFDRVFGQVPHRFNLHVTSDEVEREGNLIKTSGRFDLDLHCFVQHPQQFELESGEFIPMPERCGEGDTNPHRQKYFRLYNQNDGVYRTLLFAKERERSVAIEKIGHSGMKIVTPEYIDYVFVGDETMNEETDGIRFNGRAGWIRREANGNVRACITDGDLIEAFGVRIEGRGPWSYNMDGHWPIVVQGAPREVRIVSK